jgi:predicted regulator of Ras-like GTPase activity (Roadblock/LC7/MglB family)
MTMGSLVEVSVTGSEGQLFLYSAGPKAVLAVISPQGANAGLVHLEARGTARDMGDLLGVSRHSEAA